MTRTGLGLHGRATSNVVLLVGCVLLPVAALVGCGGEEPTPPPALPTLPQVYVGPTLTEGYGMGVDTSGDRTNWVSDRSGYMECRYPSGQDWGAVFVTVGEPTSQRSPRGRLDCSAYSYLVMELRGAAGGEQVSVGVKTDEDPDNGLEPKHEAAALTTSWETVRIPLSTLVREPTYPASRFTRLYVVMELVFEPGTPAETVLFRNIRFEQ